jgi:hypothetical protein
MSGTHYPASANFFPRPVSMITNDLIDHNLVKRYIDQFNFSG